jgi:hypothetical protein
VRAPAESYKSGVYDNGGTSYLSCSYRSCVPRSSGWIRFGVLGVLRVRRHVPASVLPLIATILWLRTTSSDSFRDPTHHDLCDLVRSLHRD